MGGSNVVTPEPPWLFTGLLPLHVGGLGARRVWCIMRRTGGCSWCGDGPLEVLLRTRWGPGPNEVCSDALYSPVVDLMGTLRSLRGALEKIEGRTELGLLDGTFVNGRTLNKGRLVLQDRSVVLGNEPHDAQNGAYDQGEERQALGRCHGEHGKIPS